MRAAIQLRLNRRAEDCPPYLNAAGGYEFETRSCRASLPRALAALPSISPIPSAPLTNPHDWNVPRRLLANRDRKISENSCNWCLAPGRVNAERGGGGECKREKQASRGETLTAELDSVIIRLFGPNRP